MVSEFCPLVYSSEENTAVGKAFRVANIVFMEKSWEEFLETVFANLIVILVVLPFHPMTEPSRLQRYPDGVRLSLSQPFPLIG